MSVDEIPKTTKINVHPCKHVDIASFCRKCAQKAEEEKELERRLHAEEGAWPPANLAAALELRDARIRELQNAQLECSRRTKGNGRERALLAVNEASERLRRVNAWIAEERRRIHLGEPAPLTRLALVRPVEEIADEGELEEVPMSNGEFLLYVARMRAAGEEGPITRPMVRRRKER